MDRQSLELAADFCALVGKSNLLEYLGLPESASPDAIQKKFKARRKYMQGMQSNPKYKTEAIFLIKNFTALTKVVENPVPYLQDAKRRSESQHLPVLEMTIKGILAGGSLNYDQEDYLRRNAIELGVSEHTFEETLRRLSMEAGIQRAQDRLIITPDELKATDFYQLLGVPRHASHDEIYSRYRERAESCKTIAEPRQRDAARTKIEKAWKVLSEEESRQQYDLTWTRTGPPARNREVSRPVQSSTAPPVQPRSALPPTPLADTIAPAPQSVNAQVPARLEILSQLTQTVQVSATPVTVSIEVRNAGEMPLRGTVTSDQPWLKVLNATLQPGVKQQAVRVQVDPSQFSGKRALGQVTLFTESGTSESVKFDVSRDSRPVPWGPIGGLVVVALLGALVFVGLNQGESSYTIHVDPWAEEVLLDGKPVGSGNLIVLDAPPEGETTITVRHGNFRPWVKDVMVEPGGSISVDLVLDTKMVFVPGPEHKLAPLDEREAVEAMKPFQAGLDRCLRSGMAAKSVSRGAVKIHIGKSGRAVGFELEGAPVSPATQECVERQAAGPVFPPFDKGDFATVRYEYVVDVP